MVHCSCVGALAQLLLARLEGVGGVDVPRLSGGRGWRAECFLGRDFLFQEYWPIFL